MATSPMDQLDDEILAKILAYCPKTQDSYLRLENVCQKWRQVVEKHQGILLIAAGFNIMEDPRNNDNTLMVKDVKGYSRIQVGEYSSKITSMVGTRQGGIYANQPTGPTTPQECGDSSSSIIMTTLHELQNKLPCPPDFVRKLCFMGNLPIQVPSGYLMLCKNLSGLHFHLSSLLGIQLMSPHLLIMDIPTLQTFVLDSYGLEQSWKNDTVGRGLWYDQARLNMIHILDVALTLLGRNTFPRLSTLIVDIPLCPEKEKGMVETLCKFLSRHRGSIQSFCFHQGFGVLQKKKKQRGGREDSSSSDNSNTDEDGDEDMEEVNDEEENEVSLSSLASSSTELKKVSLKELHIGIYSPQESDPLWINFMIQQTKLEKLIFTGDRIPFPGITVGINQSTLTTLIMEVRDNVDCGTLKDCAHLRKLCLFGKNEDNGAGDDDDTFIEQNTENNNNNGGDSLVVNKHVNVFNLQLLPHSLENLRVNRLKIDASGIFQVICAEGGVNGGENKWARLQNLELIDCGVEGNLGVPLQAVAYIMEKKRFKWFQIDYSLNRKSVLNERNDDLPAPLEMLAYTLKCNSISNFTIQGHLSSSITGVGNYCYNICKPLVKNLKMTEEFGGVEMDLFQFPEEIYPTGSFRLVPDEVDNQKKPGGAVIEINNSSTDDDGDDNDSSSMYEDMSGTDED